MIYLACIIGGVAIGAGAVLWILNIAAMNVVARALHW